MAKTVQFKRLARLTYGEAIPQEDQGRGDIPVFGSNGAFSTCDKANTLAPVVLLGRKGSFGKTNWSDVPCWATDTTFFIDRNSASVDLRWLYWSLQTLGLDVESVEAAVPGINREEVYEKRLPVISLEIQKRTAAYLDSATGLIDQLLAAKLRLLDLLAEKRRVLVASFVTQGLNADAPRRDSGILWLGEIPAHWEIWRVGHFAEVGNGSTPLRDNLDYWSGGHIPWLNSAATNDQIIKGANQFVTKQAISECHLPLVQPGSVLVAITGQGKTRGQAALLELEATINQHVAYVTPKTDLISSEFLRLWFVAQYDFLRAISDDAGGTKGALTCEQIANLRIAIPPVSEQAAIVDRTQSETNKLDALAEATERTIALLQERRSALISAAITGQLEVGETTA